MTRFLLLLVIVGLSEILIAQVPNNNIQNRLTLVLHDSPVFSSTSQSTVEWECINKALTNKCLVYHNDQWFNFSVPEAGTFFINISGQKCRDLRGLQLIVIEGNPCETKSYRIRHCIPRIIQDDVFVQLDSLQPKTQYLLNVDGFLGDFCEFGIQISDAPNGLPRTYQSLDSMVVVARRSQKGRQVKLEWTVDERRIDQLQSFKIYRTDPYAIKSNLIHDQSITRNSYGAYVLNYQAIDSLQKEGVFTYRILGVQKQTQVPLLLGASTVTFTELKSKVAPQRIVKLPLSIRPQSPFTILVYDDVTHNLLQKQRVETIEPTGNSIDVDLGKFIDLGSVSFMILIHEAGEKEPQEFYYRRNLQGQLIRD